MTKEPALKICINWLKFIISGLLFGSGLAVYQAESALALTTPAVTAKTRQPVFQRQMAHRQLKRTVSQV